MHYLEKNVERHIGQILQPASPCSAAGQFGGVYSSILIFNSCRGCHRTGFPAFGSSVMTIFPALSVYRRSPQFRAGTFR